MGRWVRVRVFAVAVRPGIVLRLAVREVVLVVWLWVVSKAVGAAQRVLAAVLAVYLYDTYVLVLVDYVICKGTVS